MKIGNHNKAEESFSTFAAYLNLKYYDTINCTTKLHASFQGSVSLVEKSPN
jgi:hypothetical protein